MKITTKKDEGRLDRFLVNNLKEMNRSQIKKAVDEGLVLVNGKRVKAGFELKKGDKIEIKAKNKEADKEEFLPKKYDRSVIKTSDKIKVIAQADDYLLIDKPAGLVVHGAEHIKEFSLADWILDNYPAIKGVGEDDHRPGIVHRLDKSASGLMVIAKTQASYESLKKQFQNRKVVKKYKVLVYGKTSKEEDSINFPIKRSSSGAKQAAIPKGSLEEDKARDAVTEFRVDKSYINYSLLDVKIKTGRKHQIRAHMHAYGHPVVGDDLYSTKKTRENNRKISLGRIFLVSYRLAFNDLSGKRVFFEIGLPKELKDVLEKIK